MPAWLKDAVFYEIYPQSFYDSNGDGIGDINGITEKLDYVKNLGCNAIWMNPCYDSPFMDAGYDVRDYKKVAPRYGTNADLVRLFKTAHKKGIKILLDLVPGHTSDTCEWFMQSKKPEKNEYSDRYIWTDTVWEAPPQYRLMCGITDRNGNYLTNFFSSQPALNYGFNKITHPKWQKKPDDPACRATVEAVKDIMRFWLDKGCDGFRVDMADSLVKNDDDKVETAKIWRGVRAMLDKDYPEAAMVSEWCDPVKSINNAGFHMDFYLDHSGNGYSTLFRDYWNGEEKSFFSPKGKGDITILTNEYVPNLKATAKNGYISFFTCNHDIARMTNNLDDTARRLAYCTIFTLPGVPFLYYGDEIGMKYQGQLTSKEGGFGRTGSRTPMQWSKGKNLGFSEAPASKLYLPVDKSGDAPTVAQCEKDKDSIYHTVKDIIAIRHAEQDLQSDGPFEVIYAEKQKYPFIYRRGKCIVFVNPSAKETEVPYSGKAGQGLYAVGKTQFANGKVKMGGQSFLLMKAE